MLVFSIWDNNNLGKFMLLSGIFSHAQTVFKICLKIFSASFFLFLVVFEQCQVPPFYFRVNSWFSSWIPEHKSQERRKLSTELLAIIINVLPWANIAVAHLWLRMSDSPYHHTSVRTNRVCQKNNFCLKKQEPLVTSSHVKFQLSEFDISQSHFYCFTGQKLKKM